MKKCHHLWKKKNNMNKEKILLVIDMNNGFTREGNMLTENLNNLVLPIKKFIIELKKQNAKIVYYSDAHSIDDNEFKIYPVHCLKGTHESEYVDELLGLNDYYIEKQTTNGFNSKNPFEFATSKNPDFYVVGGVTEICVKNITISLLKYIKNNSIDSNVYVVSDLVATFDGKNNDANIRHSQALNEMKESGAKVTSAKEILMKNCHR